MSQRASRMFTTGAGLIALALLLPVLERDPAVTAPLLVVLALPWIALLTAVRVNHVAVSHAAFPASFLPAVIYMPGLFSGRAWAGVGGILTLFAIVVLFAAFFTFAAPNPASPPLQLRLRPLSRAHAAIAIIAASLVAGLVAIWSPLASSPASTLVTGFGAVASVALVAVVVATVRRLKVELVAYEPEFVRQTLNTERVALSARRRRALIGIALATLTGAAGILWYLRRGLI